MIPYDEPTYEYTCTITRTTQPVSGRMGNSITASTAKVIVKIVTSALELDLPFTFTNFSSAAGAIERARKEAKVVAQQYAAAIRAGAERTIKTIIVMDSEVPIANVTFSVQESRFPKLNLKFAEDDAEQAEKDAMVWIDTFLLRISK